MEKTRRILSIDLLRIIAILSVVMIHTTMAFEDYDATSSSYFIGNIFNGVSRAGVPLFLMISGALLLKEDRKYSVKQVFQKYVLSIVVIFASWSFVYALQDVIRDIIGGKGLHFYHYIRDFILGKYHMWYIYMLVGIYLTLPLLQLFVKKENAQKIKYLIIISLVFNFLPSLISVASNILRPLSFINTPIYRVSFEFVGPYITYLLTGYYIYNFEIKHKHLIYVISIISVVSDILLVQMTNDVSDAYTPKNLFVFIYTIGIFIFINEKFKRPHDSKIISTISELSFGIYISHVLMLSLVDYILPTNGITVYYIVIRYILVMAFSIILCFVMSKIPLIKKLIRC